MTQRFLLDESLMPGVAEALSIVGYRIDSAVSVFQRFGTKDPEIIDWCRDSDAVWINADNRARKQHKAKLQASRVRTLWIRRPRGNMSGREQLRIISCALPIVIDRIGKSTRRHFDASSVNELSRVTVKEAKLD